MSAQNTIPEAEASRKRKPLAWILAGLVAVVAAGAVIVANTLTAPTTPLADPPAEVTIIPTASATPAATASPVAEPSTIVEPTIPRSSADPTPPAIPVDQPIPGVDPTEPIKARDKVTTKTVVIAFTTQTVNDPTLNFGATKIIRKGVNGSKTVTYVNGKIHSVKITVQPVSQITAKGTKPVVTVKTEKIPFAKKTINDPSLDYGTNKVTQAGVNGSKTVTYTNGKKTSETITAAPVDQLTVKGTKPVVTTKVETIAFAKKTVNDASMNKGDTKIVQKGVDGSKTVTYTNGKKTSETITAKPVDQITAVGTKAAEKPKKQPYVIGVDCHAINETKSVIIVSVIDPDDVGYDLHLEVGNGSYVWKNWSGSQPFTTNLKNKGGDVSHCKAWLT